MDWEPRFFAADPTDRTDTTDIMGEEKAKIGSSVSCVSSVSSSRSEKSHFPATLYPFHKIKTDWPELFARFVLSRCRFTYICEVTALHRAFGGWCAERGDAVCDLPAFAALLREAGLPMVRGRVMGLCIADPLATSEPS